MTKLNGKQRIYRGLAVVLATALSFQVTVFAQTPAAAPSAAASPTAASPSAAGRQSLRVLTLVGNNGVNDLERQIMSPLAVQILDQNDHPVEGATVIFRFPINGPSATFPNQQTLQTVQTGANGQARSVGWTANNVVGTFAVQVTATRGPDQGTASIIMANLASVIPESQIPKKRWWTSKWAKIAYVATAGAIATGVVLSRTGSTSISGTPGIPTIGGPQ